MERSRLDKIVLEYKDKVQVAQDYLRAATVRHTDLDQYLRKILNEQQRLEIECEKADTEISRLDETMVHQSTQLGNIARRLPAYYLRLMTEADIEATDWIQTTYPTDHD